MSSGFIVSYIHANIVLGTSYYLIMVSLLSLISIIPLIPFLRKNTLKNNLIKNAAN